MGGCGRRGCLRGAEHPRGPCPARSLNMLMSPQFLQVLQLCVGFVFAASALAKLLRYSDFLTGLREYQLVPPSLISQAGIALIVIEALFALAHLTGILLANMLPFVFALLGLFAVATIRLLRQGHSVHCLCFGTGHELVSVRTLVRIGLLACTDGLLWAAK